MKTADWIIKFRWLIIIGFVLLTAIVGTQIPKAEIEADMSESLPSDMCSKINNDKIEEIFGGDDMLLILFETDDVLNKETLLRIKNISKKIKRIKGVSKVMSLFDLKNIHGEDGAMIIDPAVKRIPKNKKQREKLREELKNNDMVYKVVVSKDFKITAIIARLCANVSLDKNTINEVDKILEEFPGKEKVHKGGKPYILHYVRNDISVDMIRLIPVALIIMLIMLFAVFKRLRGVLLPFIIVIMSIIFGIGFLPLFGWKISVITILLPIMIIAIANDYGIHLIARYQEMNTEESTMTTRELAKDVFTKLNKPIIITGITTIAGILGLLSHLMISARQLGIAAALSIAYALILSMFFLPAILSLLKKSRPIYKKSDKKKPLLDRWLKKTAILVTKNYRNILLGAIIIFFISLAGIFLVEVDSNMVDFFPEKHPLKISSNLINENFGGYQNINVLVNGDIKSPEILKNLDYYENELKNVKGVGNTSSIASLVKEMSKALNDKGDSYYDKIPDSREAVAQYFELYSMSGDPEDFEQIVDFDYRNTLLSVRINDGSNRTLKKVLNKIEILTQNDENVKIIGGEGLVVVELTDAITKGQLTSLILAIIVIALIIMIIFRSVSAGLISSIPLVLALAFLFGLMGYFGIKLDTATAMLSSIMIGVGVDYTIHFLWRYKEERANGLAYKDAVIKALTTTGRGITFNAISVIVGFSALFISVFLPVKFFGFLIVVSIFACLIGALIIVPAIVLILKPEFLEPKFSKNK